MITHHLLLNFYPSFCLCAHLDLIGYSGSGTRTKDGDAASPIYYHLSVFETAKQYVLDSLKNLQMHVNHFSRNILRIHFFWWLTIPVVFSAEQSVLANGIGNKFPIFPTFL